MYYIVREGSTTYKKEKVFETANKAILNKCIEITRKEYGIKASSGILTDAETKKQTYVLIERYKDQFKTLNIPVYYICVDSNDLEKAKIISVHRIDNLYEYIVSDNNFELVYNENLEMKSWLNIPYSNIDIIRNYFLENLETQKIERLKKINKLIELYPNSKEIIKKINSFIFKMPKENAITFLTTELKEDNYDLYETIKINQKQYNNPIKKLSKTRK